MGKLVFESVGNRFVVFCALAGMNGVEKRSCRLLKGWSGGSLLWSLRLERTRDCDGIQLWDGAGAVRGQLVVYASANEAREVDAEETEEPGDRGGS